MPRAALLSIHARVEHTRPTVLDDPSLVQLWGPRYQLLVAAARDLGVFSLGTLPNDPKGLRKAEETAARLRELLGDRKMTYAEAGRALGVHPNSLRYAAPTGTVVLRWDGARLSTIWTVPPPKIDPGDARLELARRYLHVCGPTTPRAFTKWAGISPKRAADAFDALGGELTAVGTPIGDAWILSADEPILRAEPGPVAPARLLPSGDPFFLLHGADRELLVPDVRRRGELWTPRVWPGCLLVGGDVAGTWRRVHAKVAIDTWRRLPPAARDAVEAEAASLPLPGIDGRITVHWTHASV